MHGMRCIIYNAQCEICSTEYAVYGGCAGYLAIFD